MNAALRARVRDKAERVAESAPDVASLLRDAATAARQAVPVEGWCGFTLDPETLVKTAGVHEAGLSPALLGRLLDLEYRHDDGDRFADLARSRRPAAVLAAPDGPARIALAIERSRPESTAALALDGYGLSARERQIAEMLIAGRNTAQVAASLFLSPHTVRDHLKSIFVKTGVRSRQELVASLVRL
ncbi:helix-turn-helix transcriptional regulator [Micromonospora sp. CPCC 206061]|uniref:helix-turn-helix transcriptional regulator n=1 Tax=Micromonospora sp. CPCC 206061 TaxID=3122410 RepID=UPI002FF0FA37